jgi:hypothetical protein
MIIKSKARIIWKRERGPRQMRAALAEEARRRGRDDATVVSQSGQCGGLAKLTPRGSVDPSGRRGIDRVPAGGST